MPRFSSVWPRVSVVEARSIRPGGFWPSGRWVNSRTGFGVPVSTSCGVDCERSGPSVSRRQPKIRLENVNGRIEVHHSNDSRRISQVSDLNQSEKYASNDDDRNENALSDNNKDNDNDNDNDNGSADMD